MIPHFRNRLHQQSSEQKKGRKIAEERKKNDQSRFFFLVVVVVKERIHEKDTNMEKKNSQSDSDELCDVCICRITDSYLSLEPEQILNMLAKHMPVAPLKCPLV